MHIPLRVGETTTIMDPATGKRATVRVDAAENGQAKLTVVAPPEVSVGKVREPESPTTRH